MKKNILLLFGGGGTEHDVSLVSSKYIESTLNKIDAYNIISVEIGRDKIFRIRETQKIVELNFNRELVGENYKISLHFVIPCIHGPPGETGEIQTFFELINLPYLGCGPEASIICFNKITSKLWFNALNIPNTPFEFLSSPSEVKKAHDLFDKYGSLFVKAASQGSSVGCYQIFQKAEIEKTINKAFEYSNYVLIEKMVNARELEISTYEINGEVVTTLPGEIICPSKFYSYEEKYNQNSKTDTALVAEGLSNETISQMREYAKRAFTHLKLRHLSRIDFFYTEDGIIYLNEINTFPGMTPISMFPKMMENNGHLFKDFLASTIKNNIL